MRILQWGKPQEEPKPICSDCELVLEIQKRLKTNRGYWLSTEVFVELHGSDVCDKSKGEKQ